MWTPFPIDVRKTIAIVLACTLQLYFAAVVAAVDGMATYRIGPPQITGMLASYPLELQFNTTGEALGFFGIDVSESTPELTNGGTDFSRFSFDLNASLFTDWDMIPGTGFGPGSLQSVAEFDSLTNLLPPDTYQLGNLNVDFTGSGLSPGAPGAVSLDGPDSVIGVEIPGIPASFGFIDAEFEEQTSAPDLTVASIVVPPVAFAGETFSASWIIENVGEGAAGGPWFDGIFLSTDALLDATDPLLATSMAIGSLSSGESYSNSQVFTLPGGIEGAYFLLLETDTNQEVPESNEMNNVAAHEVNIVIPEPPSLALAVLVLLIAVSRRFVNPPLLRRDLSRRSSSGSRCSKESG